MPMWLLCDSVWSSGGGCEEPWGGGALPSNSSPLTARPTAAPGACGWGFWRCKFKVCMCFYVCVFIQMCIYTKVCISVHTYVYVCSGSLSCRKCSLSLSFKGNKVLLCKLPLLYAKKALIQGSSFCWVPADTWRFGFTDCIDILHQPLQLGLLKISLEIIQLGKTSNCIEGCYLFLLVWIAVKFHPSFCLSQRCIECSV